MKDQTEQVTISKEEYEQLLEDSLFLECLNRCGVDNWDWYSDAQEMYRNEAGDTDND